MCFRPTLPRSTSCSLTVNQWYVSSALHATSLPIFYPTPHQLFAFLKPYTSQGGHLVWRYSRPRRHLPCRLLHQYLFSTICLFPLLSFVYFTLFSFSLFFFLIQESSLIFFLFLVLCDFFFTLFFSFFVKFCAIIFFIYRWKFPRVDWFIFDSFFYSTWLSCPASLTVKLHYLIQLNYRNSTFLKCIFPTW